MRRIGIDDKWFAASDNDGKGRGLSEWYFHIVIGIWETGCSFHELFSVISFFPNLLDTRTEFSHSLYDLVLTHWYGLLRHAFFYICSKRITF